MAGILTKDLDLQLILLQKEPRYSNIVLERALVIATIGTSMYSAGVPLLIVSMGVIGISLTALGLGRVYGGGGHLEPGTTIKKIGLFPD